MTQTILVIEDEPTQRMLLSGLCERLGYRVAAAANGKEALFFLKKHGADAFCLAFTDLNMPEMGGRETLLAIREVAPAMPVIVLTASDSLADAVEMMRLGAQDFINKPFEAERIKVSIQNAMEMRVLRQEVSRLQRKEGGGAQFDDLVGAEGGLKEAINVGRKMASSDLPVLITGESGVGKEVFARAIHGESKRGGKPFVAINCGAIPHNLAESILFGHEKGAFTGATSKYIGKFREAQGGTLFLDEIGELPADLQVKLLRAIQQKEIDPVGASTPVPVDVRIISATHRDLAEDVKDARFREDLFYRLNVLPLHLPALRDRKDDLQPLAEYFLGRIGALEHQAVKSLSADAFKWMQQYNWPGNVREMENMLARASLLCDGSVISSADLELFSRQSLKPMLPEKAANADVVSLLRPDGSPKTMDEIYDEVVERTLVRLDANVSKAADILEIGQSTLYRRLSYKRP